MSRLIMYSSYINNKSNGSKKHSKNLIEYIATREGVDYFVSDENKNLEVTEPQKFLIYDLVDEYKFLKDIDEYREYLKNKNVVNASQFLTSAFELIKDEERSKEVYLKYISERPRVEKFKNQDHGLFNDKIADVEKEIESIKKHDGTVWTHIISLKREDAKNLGFENAKAWQDLLSANIQEISKAMGIERKNLVWNAAFHNESHHPHVHLVVYSKNKNEGYLTSKGIEKIKSCLANEIFKQELLIIKEEKTLSREKLKSEFEKELDKTYSKIISKDFKVSEKLSEEILKLSSMIENKKLNYGYQPREVKEQVDKVFNLMMKNKELNKIYDIYLEKHKELMSYYKDNPKVNSDITENKDFRVLQNKILKAIRNFEIKEENKVDLKDKVANEFLKLVEDDSLIKYHKEELNKLIVQVNKEKNKLGFESQSKYVQGLTENLFNKIIENNSEIKENLKKISSRDFEKELHSELFTNISFEDNKIQNKNIEKTNDKDHIKKDTLDELFKVASADDFINLYKEELIKLSSKNTKDNQNAEENILKVIVDSNENIKSNLEKLDNKSFEKELAEKIFSNEKENKSENIIKDTLIDKSKELKKEYMLNKNIKVEYKDFSEKNKEEMNRFTKSIILEIASNLYHNTQYRENEIRNRKTIRNKLNKTRLNKTRLNKTMLNGMEL